jgi:hypothetical protein
MRALTVFALYKQHQCKALSYLLAFEAFVGILLASFCGAIFFTKLQRVEYSANVNFSSCMCLLYGSGLTDTKLDIIQSLTVSLLAQK